MTTYYSSINATLVKSVPIVKRLNAIFRSIPDKDLLAPLKARTGRSGYTVGVPWKTYIASVVLEQQQAKGNNGQLPFEYGGW